MAEIIVCPKCGEEFDKPRFERKRFGWGPAPPGMGTYKCPKCGYKGRSNEFAPP